MGLTQDERIEKFFSTRDRRAYWRAARRKYLRRVSSEEARIAELAGITVEQARIVRLAVFRVMKEALLRGEDVRIARFGRFVPATYKTFRTRSGAPPRHRVAFTPYAALLYLLNPKDPRWK